MLPSEIGWWMVGSGGWLPPVAQMGEYKKCTSLGSSAEESGCWWEWENEKLGKPKLTRFSIPGEECVRVYGSQPSVQRKKLY